MGLLYYLQILCANVEYMRMCIPKKKKKKKTDIKLYHFVCMVGQILLKLTLTGTICLNLDGIFVKQFEKVSKSTAHTYDVFLFIIIFMSSFSFFFLF